MIDHTELLPVLPSLLLDPALRQTLLAPRPDWSEVMAEAEARCTTLIDEADERLGQIQEVCHGT